MIWFDPGSVQFIKLRKECDNMALKQLTVRKMTQKPNNKFSGFSVRRTKIRIGEPIRAAFHNDVLDTVRENLEHGRGFACPTCSRHMKIHKRKISKTMLEALRILSVHDTPLSSAEINLRLGIFGSGGNHHLLQHWGLIEKTPDKKWKLTETGRDFLNGTTEVSKYVLLYQRNVVGFSKKKANIHSLTTG